MNIRQTKSLFRQHDVIAVKADKDKVEEVDELLRELGNTATAIPYYAVFAPGLPEPIHFGGNVLTPGTVRDVVERAVEVAGKWKAEQQELATAGR